MLELLMEDTLILDTGQEQKQLIRAELEASKQNK
jgi:hypothetical protein